MASRIREIFSSNKEDPVYRVSYSQHQRRAGLESRTDYASKSHRSALPVIELRVPMCCEKCKEKVKEELEEMDGVKDVICDQFNQRVTVTGYVDPLRALRKVKRIKKKSEFFTTGSYIDHATHHGSGIASHELPYTGQSLVHGGGGLTRTNSFGRDLARMPSFGKVSIQYTGARRHEFESDHVPRDYYGVRRMPSFKKHRYHDAEYVSMGDQFTPHYGDTHYVHQHSRRPVLHSQVSFSKLLVRNPYYVQPIYHEY